jgi:hypothetical protein
MALLGSHTTMKAKPTRRGLGVDALAELLVAMGRAAVLGQEVPQFAAVCRQHDVAVMVIGAAAQGILVLCCDDFVVVVVVIDIVIAVICILLHGQDSGDHPRPTAGVLGRFGGSLPIFIVVLLLLLLRHCESGITTPATIGLLLLLLLLLHRRGVGR